MILSKFKNTCIVATCILLLGTGAFINLGFKNKQPNTDNLLIVGIGWSKKMCGNSGYNEAICYYGITTSANKSYADAEREIKTTLTSNYNVYSNDVNISSSYKQMAVIIKFNKQIGQGCSVIRYAIGYGDTHNEAEAAAVRSKNNDDRQSAYYEVTTINK
jgi:hypothetical protein